jgi:hypothetical protein
MAAVAAEGRQAIQTAMKELKAAGYVETRKSQDALGHWITTTIVYDTPVDLRNAKAAVNSRKGKKERVDNASHTASEIVANAWEPNSKNNVQAPVAVVKIVANALRNGVSDRKITKALITIAAAGETVTNYRLNKVLQGYPTRGTIAADVSVDWSKESTVL